MLFLGRIFNPRQKTGTLRSLENIQMYGYYSGSPGPCQGLLDFCHLQQLCNLIAHQFVQRIRGRLAHNIPLYPAACGIS